MRIGIFDLRVTRNNPIGGCHRAMMEALCDRHDFVVFAPEFDNPRPDRITHVKMWMPMRPQVLQFIIYHALAPLLRGLYQLRTGHRFDLIQAVENNIRGADVIYAHFCHGTFIRRCALLRDGISLNVLFRWVDHHLRAATEAAIYRRGRYVVVPSQGLKDGLEAEFPFLAGRVTVIPNPVEISTMRRPESFDRAGFRTGLGLAEDDIVMAFSALGHFERKGLPTLFDALARLPIPTLKLMVVGGQPGLIKAYKAKARERGIADRVLFCGLQKDVRPYLWAADAFTLPSTYETFSLVFVEAAAATLPIVIPRLYGVEQYGIDGFNVLYTETDLDSLTAAISRLLAMTPEQRRLMGEKAAAAVAGLGPEAFVDGWRDFYDAYASRNRDAERAAVPVRDTAGGAVVAGPAP